MNDLQKNIVECLTFFGPSTLHTIQQKLDLRGIVKSQVDIEKECEALVEDKKIRAATGFDDIGYKV